ncbi:MAG TPA: DivIVA domain-containing protein, partial [Acidimicrobiales bacterium]|nr:DivIVA domain-containing protein [Acidimicrobiales bacterium]
MNPVESKGQPSGLGAERTLDSRSTFEVEVSSGAMSADMIARRTFTLVRRGYDPREVRSFLSKLAQQVSMAARKENELERSHRELEMQLSDLNERIGHVTDESYLTETLGHETSKILQAAHEAAAQLQARSEAAAKKMLKEAQRKALALVEETDAAIGARVEASEAAVNQAIDAAQREAETIASDGISQGQEIIEKARGECRELIRKTQQLRKEILTDLVKRRKELTVQVESLHAGRDALRDSLRELQVAVNKSWDEFSEGEARARSAAGEAGRRSQEDQLGQQLGELAADVGDFSQRTSGSSALPASTVPMASGASTQESTETPVVALDHASQPARKTLGSSIDEIRKSIPLPDLVSDMPEDTGPAPKSAESQVESPLPVPASGPTETLSPVLGDDFSVDPDLGPGLDRTAPVHMRGAADAITEEVLPARGLASARKEQRRKKGRLATMLGLRSSDSTGEVGHLPTGMRPLVEEIEPGLSTVKVLETEPGSGEHKRPQVPAAPNPFGEQPEQSGLSAGEAPSTAGFQAPLAEPKVASASAEGIFEKMREGIIKDHVENPTAALQVPLGLTDESGVDSPAPLVPETSPSVLPLQEGSSAEMNPSLVASQADEEMATDSEDEVVLTKEQILLERRDGMLNPILVDLNRRLKRTLQDEQNELMDKIRLEGPKSPLELLGPADEQEDIYRKEVLEYLVKAGSSGALFATGKQDFATSLPDDLVGGLAGSITSWLRANLDKRYSSAGIQEITAKREAVAAATRVVTSTYRECKAAFLEEVARDHAIGAFSRGILESLGIKATLQWVVDDGGAACPDCEDNALAGNVRAWEEYPTGQLHPPA